MNTDKLLMLLDKHRDWQASYRLLTARYRGAAKEVAKLEAELTAEVEDLAESIVTMPTEALARVTPEEIDAAGISDIQRRRLLAARRLAERLRLEAETQAGELKQSQALTERLVEYASQRGELVHL